MVRGWTRDAVRPFSVRVEGPLGGNQNRETDNSIEMPDSERLQSVEFDLATLSDPGTDRSDNEDSCGTLIEGPVSAIFAVADGVGGYEGGEVASAMAVDITLKSYRESPVEWGPAKRLHWAFQNANIEIHNRALAVPELRRMATTLTAVSIERGVLKAAHVGDCRLYIVRGNVITQISKDHTMVADRVRMGLMSEARARTHPERSALLRTVGRDLIVSVDRIAMTLGRGDTLVLCSDGLYNVLEDREVAEIVRKSAAAEACRGLVDEANRRGTADNLTVAVFRMLSDPPETQKTSMGWRGRLKNLFGRH